MSENFEKLIADYITVRDAKAAKRKEQEAALDRYTRVMKKIEERILSELNDQNMDSIKSKAGTAYRNTQSSAKVVDREAFLGFVRASEAWNFLETKAAKSAVEEYIQEHGDTPPGVDVSRAHTVNIRRA